MVYYNEIDPFCAEWLRNLIKAGHIASGEVDERDIRLVQPDDLRGFTQCHFFAGIGVWSYALRLARWPDDREVWTGSCPCQPFSAAGKGEAYADERHLWPHWYRLISECRPAALFGEQVDAAIRSGWLDDVCLSLESLGYAVGAVDFPACSVGAPHIRQRLFFVADADQERRPEYALLREGSFDHSQATGRSEARELADADGRDARAEGLQRSGKHGFEPQDDGAGRLEHSASDGRIEGWAEPSRRGATSGCSESIVGDSEIDGRQGRHLREATGRQTGGTATAGFWADADWLPCIDGKARPVESGTFPLAHGAPARVGRLRAYGNAINAEQARMFIETYRELMP